MTISVEEVLKIAALARLQVREEDAAHYAVALSKIVSLAEQMNAIDTRAVTPMAHPLEVVQRLREDEVTETDRREEFQTLAPQVQRGFYVVPRVIE